MGSVNKHKAVTRPVALAALAERLGSGAACDTCASEGPKRASAVKAIHDWNHRSTSCPVPAEEAL